MTKAAALYGNFQVLTVRFHGNIHQVLVSKTTPRQYAAENLLANRSLCNYAVLPSRAAVRNLPVCWYGEAASGHELLITDTA